MVVKSIYIWGLLNNLDDTLKDGQSSHLKLILRFNRDVIAKLIYFILLKDIGSLYFHNNLKVLTFQVADCWPNLIPSDAQPPWVFTNLLNITFSFGPFILHPKFASVCSNHF